MRPVDVDPGCKRYPLTEEHEFKPGASVPDPFSEHGYMCDAVGYAAIALAKGLLRINLALLLQRPNAARSRITHGDHSF